MDYQTLATKVFEIYTTKSVSRTDELVHSLYATKAIFSDNITYVKTAPEIALMFRGLAVTFPVVDVQVHDVRADPAPEGAAHTTTLDDQGRIQLHQDTWQDRSSMPRFLRGMGGSFTNLMLRMTGVSRKK